MLNRNPNSINCATASDWLHLLLDEELSESRHKLLAAHLESCEKCRAAWHELKLIERTHARLDLRLTEPPPDYFAQLPKRVLARLDSEKTAAPAILKMPDKRPRVLWLQKFTTGKGKYALALAAAAALVFFWTLGKKDSSSLATSEQREHAILASDTIAFAAAEPSAVSDLKRISPKDSARRLEREAPLVAGSPGAAPDEERLAAAAKTQERSFDASLPETLESDQQNRRSEKKHEGEFAETALRPGRAALPAESLAQSSLAKTGELAQNVEPQASKELLNLQRGVSHSLALEARQFPQGQSESGSSPFSQALQQAQAAPNAESRQKIWWDFLATNPDTAYYYLAIGNLARSLSATADSGSNRAHLDQTLQFYQQMDAILAPQLGVETVRFERARLEGLLHWKMQTEGR
ncbi:zf-HC2 domain-containing protein [bacterium]|nr:zf-HC2 domain-containing protein [bacterium]RIK66595.1 MAG: hypothetical protein DCC62_25150 [candidate division KSB1 bacterium]